MVIGAGQAGLSTAHYLARLGLGGRFVVLDGAPGPGGAWRNRWDSLTLGRAHGVHDLPSLSLADAVGAADGRLVLRTDDGDWATRSLVNATGTWEKPFWPAYPGRETFTGRQLHAADYRSSADLAGAHVVVVGGGASAVQLLLEISAVVTTTWVTRREPLWRNDFTPEIGRGAIALVEQRVVGGGITMVGTRTARPAGAPGGLRPVREHDRGHPRRPRHRCRRPPPTREPVASGR